jgi:hypothetical protein
MEASGQPDEYLSGGLSALGIEADEIEMAVITGTHALFWPEILGLLALDLGDAAPERDQDVSRAPRA